MYGKMIVSLCIVVIVILSIFYLNTNIGNVSHKREAS